MDYTMPTLSLDPVADAEEQLRRAMVAGRRPSVLPRSTRRVNAGGSVTTSVQPNASTSAMQPGESYVRQALDLYGQEDDYSEAQRYARDRAQEGDSAMLNALAAQFAGPDFEPVGAAYLKRALASREPLRFGNTTISPDGTVLKDPGAARQRQADKLLQLGQFEMTLDDRNKAREREEMLRLSLAQMRGDNGADDARVWRAEDKLRNDFEKITGDLRTELGATRKITEIVAVTPPGSRPDAITQQSLVILLNKFLDPGSVVREGEFDRVVKAQGLDGQARNLSNRLLKGEPLNDDAIRQINGLAQLYQRAAETKMRAIAGQYANVARSRGLEVGSVILDNGLLGTPSPVGQAGQQIIDLPPLR